MPGIQRAGDNASSDALLEAIAGLVTSGFDYVAVTYVAAGNGEGNIETVTYKTGGSGGTTVATITITYDASDRIADITSS